MSVPRSKKRGNVCKAHTEGNVHGKVFVLNYEITFKKSNIVPFALSVRSQKHTHMRDITSTES